MDRREIIDALTALASELERRGVSGEMYIVDGAAIALAFDERRATRDIDAVFEPKSVIYDAAETVAEQRNLPGGWLNDAVKGFLEGDDPGAAPVLDLPGLRWLQRRVTSPGSARLSSFVPPASPCPARRPRTSSPGRPGGRRSRAR